MRHEQATDLLAYKWRAAILAVDQCLYHIAGHQRVLAARTERPAYLAYAANRLRERLAEYRRALRALHEAERHMDVMGVEYRR